MTSLILDKNLRVLILKKQWHLAADYIHAWYQVWARYLEGDSISTKIRSDRGQDANLDLSRNVGIDRVGHLNFLNVQGKSGKLEDNIDSPLI